MVDSSVSNPPARRAQRIADLDLDFSAERSESAFSDLHWHPCRYPSQIPSVVLGRLSAPGDLVIDPFAGSGTTLVEAQRLGRRGIGIDINPVAVLMCTAKTLPIPASDVEAAARAFEHALVCRWSELAPAPPPPSVQAEKWYTPATLHSLLKLWGEVAATESAIAPVLKAAFSSILLQVCRETRHWGYVCDNSTPKTNNERDVLKTFRASLSAWREAYQARDRFLAKAELALAPCEAVAADAATYLSLIPSGSAELVLTSPPYQGVADYVKSQRLSMEWFGHQIEPLRAQEIGARSKRLRRQAREEYVRDLKTVLAQCHRVLSRTGHVALVIGESSKRAPILAETLSEVSSLGFVTEAMRDRQISASRRQMPSVSRETVVILRRA